MNRKEIEKKFDERFGNTGLDVLAEPIKSFFFDDILPEVLSDIIPEEKKWDGVDYDIYILDKKNIIMPKKNII